MINYVNFVVFIFTLIQGQISSLEERYIKAYQNDFIVPHLLPSAPPVLTPIVYKPGLIILPGKPYFPYQIKGLPDITWDLKDETYYTIIILGTFQQLSENAAPKDSRSCSKISVTPTQHWWHQLVKVNVFENCIDTTGIDLKPFLDSNMLEPNKTHRVLYAIAVYEQKDKIELNLDDKDNTPDKLLERHFTPVSNFEKNFPGSVQVGGNFFHVIEKYKLGGGIREDLFDPKALKLKKSVESARRDDYRYFGL